MNVTEARAAVFAALFDIAPEVDGVSVGDDRDLRRAADLDSLDFLRLVESVARATGVDIPESDYSEVRTVGAMAHYLASHSGPEGSLASSGLIDEGSWQR